MSSERKFNRRSFEKLFGPVGLLFLASCAPKIFSTETPTPFSPKTPVPTGTPSPPNTPTRTEIPTLTPTENRELFLENPVRTPPSLMLHSKDLPQLKNLLPMLGQAGYQALTYENYYDTLLKKTPLKDPILITIDDLEITYLSPGQKGMISLMEECGMHGTLGIMTRGTRKEAKPEIWKYLKRLQDKGWELANHTEDHISLPSCTDKNLRYQIKETYDEIFDATGKAPVSLILPYGKMDQRIFEICAELGIKWVVGIDDGKQFTGKSPFYVGRIPPGGTADITMKYLANSFKRI